jgi:hypothetical protein
MHSYGFLTHFRLPVCVFVILSPPHHLTTRPIPYPPPPPNSLVCQQFLHPSAGPSFEMKPKLKHSVVDPDPVDS